MTSPSFKRSTDVATSGFIENLDQCENGLVTSAQGANILISLRQARQWMGGDKRQHGSKATGIKGNGDPRQRGSKAMKIKRNEKAFKTGQLAANSN